MVRPRLHWLGILVVVLIACAAALTLAGTSSAATLGDEFGSTLAPTTTSATTTYGATGGTSAPLGSTSTPEAQSATRTSAPRHRAGKGESKVWLIIMIALIVILVVLAANIYVPAGR